MHIPTVAKGLLFISIGAILLLNTLGILQASLNSLVIAGSILMIVYGFMILDAHKKVMQLLNMLKKEKSKK